MASKILFCLLFIMIFLGIDEALSLEDSNYSIEAMHQEWMSLHRKNYSHLEEHQLRFKIFEENVNYINAFNAKPNQSYKLGINKFADLTNREFREIYASGHKPKGSHASASNEHKRFATQDLMSRPDNWDWVEHGAVTPVKNQGQCGCCWAFAAVAAVESLIWINIVNYDGTHRVASLSEQTILDCRTDSPCKGSHFDDAFDFVQQNGLTTDAYFPYYGDKVNARCNTDMLTNFGYRITDYTVMSQSPPETDLLDAVWKQPVSVSINAGTDGFKHYQGGIFDDPNCLAHYSDLNHAVTLVGYGTSGDGKKYWKLKNSWGLGWGEGGYMRIVRDPAGRHCGIGTDASYPNAPIITP